MKILGLTGPSGAGKGAAAAIFAKYGIPTVDTDAVYHALLAAGGAMTAELTEAFGKDILDAGGRVDRKRLGGVVFGKENTPALLHILNAITHKYVVKRTRELLAEFRAAGARAAIIDAPQLFEAELEKDCDIVIGVLACRDTRLTRILQRDGITREAALKRMDAQRPDAFFRENCHIILQNDSDTAALEAQIRTFLKNSEIGES